MKPFVDIRYNIFTEKEIVSLLYYFYQNEKTHKKYNDTIICELENDNKEFLNNKFKLFVGTNTIDWVQIVKWPPGAYHPFHFDDASKNTTISSITYLNHDFVGGETVFEEGTIVKASKNKTIFFSGKNIRHSVNKVLEGTRYTIATWFK
jgi:hypothetical protein